MATVHQKKRRASPTFWTRRLRQVTSSDIECDSPVRSPRSPRGTLPDRARDSLDCSPTAPWPVDSRFRTAATAEAGASLPPQATAATAWVASRAIPQLLRLYSPSRAYEPLHRQSGASTPPAHRSLFYLGPSASNITPAGFGLPPAAKQPAAPRKTGSDGELMPDSVGLPSTRCFGPNAL